MCIFNKDVCCSCLRFTQNLLYRLQEGHKGAEFQVLIVDCSRNKVCGEFSLDGEKLQG